MGRPRKHSDSRAVALRRVAAGSVPKRVAEELGIPIDTLRSWLRRGEGVRPDQVTPGPTVSGSRSESREGTGIDLTTAVEKAIRDLMAYSEETRSMTEGTPDTSTLRVIAARVAAERSAAETIKSAVAVGVPKLTVVTQTGVSGVRADVDLLRQTIALLEGAKDDSLETP